MSTENLPPFYVGQKVVSLFDGYQIKKGDIRTVLAVHRHCCLWLVDVGTICPIGARMRCSIHDTLLILKKGKPLCPESILFAPVQENFQSISLSKVLEEETKLISVN